MHQTRRRHGDLRGARSVGDDIAEFIGGDAARAAQLVLDIGGLERAVTAVRILEVEQGVARCQPLDCLDEAEEPGAAPEFAVGNALQAGIFLHLDGVEDATVQDRLKRRGVDLALLDVAEGVLQILRAQQAADVLGAKGRSCATWPSAPLIDETGGLDARLEFPAEGSGIEEYDFRRYLESPRRCRPPAPSASRRGPTPAWARPAGAAHRGRYRIDRPRL